MISVTDLTPNQIPFLPSASSFQNPELQHQAGEIENAVLGFCRSTFDNLLHLGGTAIRFSAKCDQELGEKEGKSAFDKWIEASASGTGKYILHVAMRISNRYSELKPRLQKLAREHVQLWGLRALDTLFSVSESFFELMIKRGKKSHKAIKNADNLLQGKLPNLSKGTFVEIVSSDEHQHLQGDLGTIIDKDEYGNLTVQMVESGAEVMLQNQNLSKRAPKSVNESLLGIIENLRSESLQKDQQISEYQSPVVCLPISTASIQEESYPIAAEATAKYEQETVQDNAALQPEIRWVESADSNAKDDDRNKVQAVNQDLSTPTSIFNTRPGLYLSHNSKNEALTQALEKLRQQSEEKEQLTQVILDLQRQIESEKLANLHSQQLEAHNQELQQQVFDLQKTLAATVSALPSALNNQGIPTPDDIESGSKQSPPLKEVGEPIRQELDEYKAAFTAFVNRESQPVTSQVASKPVMELISKLLAASEHPRTLSDDVNQIQQVAYLNSELEEIKANILEASKIEQQIFSRIKAMELFESNQQVRKEARTVAKLLIQSNPNKEQAATSTNRGFLPIRSAKK